MTYTRELAKRVIAAFGLEVRRLRIPEAPPPLYADPLEVISRIRKGQRAAISAPIEECVIYNGLSFGPKDWHPFVAALEEHYSRAAPRYEGSLLERYYQAWQPCNGLEALIGARLGPQTLADYPGHLMHAPWIEETPEERLEFTAHIASLESSSIGKDPMGIDEGYGLHGPVSRRKGEFESRRLIQVTESIKSRGYDRGLGDMTAQVLKRGDEFRFRVMHGQHRMAALAFLGHHTVPVIPTMLVRVDEVAHWPQVHRGTWSADEALAYFDHHFDFDARGWASGLGLVDND
ncbi:MAG TPA: hypothetical protein VMQ83_01360 [Gammaproteobacteria bacterium]|nr:hypothetical protein [Gammaproteobacteria bacterium]